MRESEKEEEEKRRGGSTVGEFSPRMLNTCSIIQYIESETDKVHGFLINAQTLGCNSTTKNELRFGTLWAEHERTR